MGCEGSKSNNVIQVQAGDKRAPLPRHVHFPDPEYVLLKTPRVEKPPIENGTPPKVVPKPEVKPRAWPLHVKAPPKAAPPPPPSPLKKRKPKRVHLHEQEVELPPPRPPKTKRKDIITSEHMFDEIDTHALNAPKSAEGSVESLARYLATPATSDFERVRVFFRWITNNITYDTDSHFRGKKKPLDASSVLRLRTTVSQGYTNLFDGLCRCYKIPVKCIHGFAKGFDYVPFEDFQVTDDTNHVWAAVHVEGDWRLIECSWAAGHIDRKRKFNWSYKDFYFMPDPENLIWSHFPVNDNDSEVNSPWQLLEAPVELNRFNKNIRPINRAIEWKVDFLSNKNVVIDVWKKVEVTVGSSNDYPVTIVTSQVFQNDAEIRQFSMVKRLDNHKYKVLFRPPSKGKFSLKILGNIGGEEFETHALVEYAIRCHEVYEDVYPYPDHYGPWGAVTGYLDYGFPKHVLIDPVLVSGDGELQFSVDTSAQIEAVTRLIYSWNNIPEIDDYAIMESTNNMLHVRARFPREGFYKLRISCKNKDGDYKPAINYLVECKNAMEPCDAFPKVYAYARELKCRLLEPLCINLLKNVKVKVQFTSDNVHTALLCGCKFVKTNENIWEVTVTPSGGKFMISGSTSGAVGSFKGLYEFRIV